MTRRDTWPAALLASTIVVVGLLAGPPAPRSVGAYPDAPPAGRTGAPAENTCNSCHSGALNDGLGTFALVNAPTSYTPGQVYPITVSLGKAGKARWGFSLTTLKNSDNSFAGTLSTGGSPLLLIQTKSSKSYISQTTDYASNDGTYAGTADGPVTWTFQWTAPAAGTGGVTFYAAGVAADNDGGDGGGDDVYTIAVPMTESVVTAVSNTTWGKIKAAYLAR